MDEAGDNMGPESNKDVINTSAVKVKPKKKSLVERELETSLTAKATSPISLGDGSSTSRYGRARRLKTDTDFCDTEKAVSIALKSPRLQITPVKVVLPAQNARRKSVSSSKFPSPLPNLQRKSISSCKISSPSEKSSKSDSSSLTKGSPKLMSAVHPIPNIEHQIKTIYNANISLSRFNSERVSDEQLPITKKSPKTYTRKDLIQSKEKEETLVTNMFSPSKNPCKKNSHLRNILERSSEKYNLSPVKSPKQPIIQLPSKNSEQPAARISLTKTKSDTQNLSKVSKKPSKKGTNLNYILQRLSAKNDLMITKSLTPRNRSIVLGQSLGLNATKLSKPQNLKTISVKSTEKCTPDTKSPKLLNSKSPKILNIKSPKILMRSPKTVTSKPPRIINISAVVQSTKKPDVIIEKTPQMNISNKVIDLTTEKDDVNDTKSKPDVNASVVKILDFDSNIKNDIKDDKEEIKSKPSKVELAQLEDDCGYQVGDLAWARMGTYPFWPCIVTREPGSELFVRKKLFGRIERAMFHVTFFGDNGRRSWIVDSMLRQFRGRDELEACREQFTPEDKKKDPRYCAAFFISEKKKALWGMSVEEAETLYKEPINQRINMLYDMLGKVRTSKTPKSQTERKSEGVIGRIKRIDSDVSLSESLYETLFSEDDGVNDDSERSRNKTRNKSLDVSEVVTACLDNMAAKTGITKIQRQSHMDIWLQKAKSKTPEKLNVSITVERMDDECPEPKICQPKEPEIVACKAQSKSSSKKKKKPLTPKAVVNVPYSFRRHVAESRNLQPFGYPSNEHDYSIKTDNIENCPTNVNEQETSKEVVQTEETIAQSSDDCQSNCHDDYSDSMPVTGDVIPVTGDLLDGKLPVINASISIDTQVKLGDINNSNEDTDTNVDNDSNIVNEVTFVLENTTETENYEEKEPSEQQINNVAETKLEDINNSIEYTETNVANDSNIIIEVTLVQENTTETENYEEKEPSEQQKNNVAETKLGDINNSNEDIDSNVDNDSNIVNDVTLVQENTTETENYAEKEPSEQQINNVAETEYDNPMSPTFSQSIDHGEEAVTRSPSPTYTQNFEDDARPLPTSVDPIKDFNDEERDTDSPTYTQAELFELEDDIGKGKPVLKINVEVNIDLDSDINAKKAVEDEGHEKHVENHNNETEEDDDIYAHLVDYDSHIRSKESDTIISKKISKDDCNGEITHLDTNKDEKTELNLKMTENDLDIDESLNDSSISEDTDKTDCDDICNKIYELCDDNYGKEAQKVPCDTPCPKEISCNENGHNGDQESESNLKMADNNLHNDESLNVSSVSKDTDMTECDDICNQIDEMCDENYRKRAQVVSSHVPCPKEISCKENGLYSDQESVISVDTVHMQEIENGSKNIRTDEKCVDILEDSNKNLPLVTTNGHATDEEINVFSKKKVKKDGYRKIEATSLKLKIHAGPKTNEIEQPNYSHIVEINEEVIKPSNLQGNHTTTTIDSMNYSDKSEPLKGAMEKEENSDCAKTVTLVRCDMIGTHQKVLKILCERIPRNDDPVIHDKHELAEVNGHESDNDSMSSELDNVALSELKQIKKSVIMAKSSIKSDQIDMKSDYVVDIKSDDLNDLKSEDLNDMKSDDLNDTSYVPSSEDVSELSETEITDSPRRTKTKRQNINGKLLKKALINSTTDEISETSEIDIDDLATRVKKRRRTGDVKLLKTDKVNASEVKIIINENESLLDVPISTRIDHKKSIEADKGIGSSKSKDLGPDCSIHEIDIDTISIHSDDSATLIVKHKSKSKTETSKNEDDPEFLKYLEFRIDTLIDEHPELNRDEIVAYLYKTWLYEESLKSDVKKTDDIQQSTLVKGTNQDTIPNKPKKYKKSKRVINIDKLMSNDFREGLKEEFKTKPRRKAAVIKYVDDLSDIEDEIQIFEIFKEKPKVIDLTGTTDNKEPVKDPSTITHAIKTETESTVIIKSEAEKTSKVDGAKITTDSENKVIKSEKAIDQKSGPVGDESLDEVERYFQQLVMPKPNIFKGLVREKVCEICERSSDLLKCKTCNGMFHVKCTAVKEEVEPPPVAVRGRKKKKTRARKPKNSTDSNLEDSQSDDKTIDPNVSEETNVSLEENSQSIIVILDDFEEKAAAKMKEILEAETAYDSYSSDDGHDWSDTVAGQCEIIDVKLKPRSPPINTSDFKCQNCQKYNTPICFICKSDVSPKSQVQTRQRCQVAHCHKYYHVDCLDQWPQTQFNSGEPSRKDKKAGEHFEALTCPRHVCHTCVCDDPRGCKTRFSGDKLARCVRCPATYHTFNKCLPAGTQILTGSHIICPRHYEHRPGKVPCHVNTGWCFICALGGSLICCEYCPTSFHAECLQIKPPEGGYMCEDCETGRLPLYGEMVWVKLGHYRWWPGIVLHPTEIPDNILAVRHSPGEFVVRFFGQYDHYWVNRGRVFPFQEGDSGRISSQKSKIDEAFTMAMEHAHRAFDILKNAEPNQEESMDIQSSLLPPHYVKLKVNKPCGSLCGRRIDIEEGSLTQCGCNPNDEEPCGPYSQCLNRMLLTECGPTCLAGDRCRNRDFEKRNYPKMVPYRTPHRGWGLKTLEPIRAGQFVIEYVGELIDEDEFRRRMARQHEVRDENFYYLTLDKERMIDAGPKGNLARFMNHCCEPNCETQKWTVLGDVRVGLFAIRDIPANTEVNFNYNLECAGIEKKRCLCGAKRCSGYIGAKPKQEESQPKKPKPVVQKRPYKKRVKNPTDDPTPSTSTAPQAQVPTEKRKRGRPRKVEKPRELTEIEKDLLIIKNATISSDSDEPVGPRNGETETTDAKALKRKRELSTDDRVLTVDDDLSSPTVKRMRIEEGSSEVGD